MSAHPSVAELARNPLLLSAICLVYHFEGGRLPDDRAVLYRLCVEGLLDRWDAQKERLAAIKANAKAAKPLVDRVASAYPKAAVKRQPESKELGLSVRPVAGAKLPVAVATVTPLTLPALAEQPDVAAVLPNQPVHVIRPSQVEYGKLAAAEQRAGATWGLRELGVPEFWAKTKVQGEAVRVTVLDTGVHAEHPALAGRL